MSEDCSSQTAWGNIPIDLAIKIAEHVEYSEDFDTFKLVCSCWRSAAKQAKFRANCKPSALARAPWLVLPEPDNTSNKLRLHSLYHGKVYNVNLPLSNIHQRRILSSRGWLLSVSRADEDISLLNPVSGAVIKLPQFQWMGEHLSCFFREQLVQKFVLSHNPSTASDFTVAVMVKVLYACDATTIYFWRNGSKRWVQLLNHIDQYFLNLDNMILSLCKDITFHKGEFYGVDIFGDIVRIEFDQSDNPGVSTVAGLEHPDLIEKLQQVCYYLVESMDHLLLVRRVRHLVDGCYRTISFEVFMLDVDIGEVVRVHHLEDVAVFVGSNSSFSAKASVARGCNPNSIYFTGDYSLDCGCNRNSIYFTGDYSLDCDQRFYDVNKGLDMGYYNLADGRIQSCYEGPSQKYSEYAPFVWLEASTT